MAVKITVNFEQCLFPPLDGYNIQYRDAGSEGAYTDAGNFTESPAIFYSNLEDIFSFEGFIRSDCGDEMFGTNVYWEVSFTTTSTTTTTTTTEFVCCDIEIVSAESEVLDGLGPYIYWLGQRTLENNITTEVRLFYILTGITGNINWGDGVIEPFSAPGGGNSFLTHEYSLAGDYLITVYLDVNQVGPFQAICDSATGDGTKVLTTYFNHTPNCTTTNSFLAYNVENVYDVIPSKTNIGQIILSGRAGNTVMSTLDMTLLPPSVTYFALGSFEGLTNITGVRTTLTFSLNLTGCPLLASVESLTIMPTAWQFSFIQNADNISIPPLNLSACLHFNYNQNLTSTQVSDFLIALDANGLTNGDSSIWQVPAATPNLAGLTAKANLISKGWTVQTD